MWLTDRDFTLFDLSLLVGTFRWLFSGLDVSLWLSVPLQMPESQQDQNGSSQEILSGENE
jgi:hypothetical protein